MGGGWGEGADIDPGGPKSLLLPIPYIPSCCLFLISLPSVCSAGKNSLFTQLFSLHREITLPILVFIPPEAVHFCPYYFMISSPPHPPSLLNKSKGIRLRT